MQINFSSNKVRAAIAAAGVVVSVGGAVMMPQVAEGAKSSCHAVEKKAAKGMIDLQREEDPNYDPTQGFGLMGVGIMNGMVEMSSGKAAETAAKAAAPNVPSGIACSARWWQANLPGGQRELALEARKAIADSFKF